MGKWIKTLVVASVLCLGLSYAAKADSIATGTGSATSDTFTGVDIYAVTTTLNPFGVTPIVCPGTGSACNQNVYGTSAPIFEVATVTFNSGGGYTITETSPSGAGDTVNVNQATALTADPGYCASAGPAIFTTGAAALTVSAGTECTSAGTFVVDSNSQAGGSVLSYLGNGVFSVTDNSFQVAFQLTPGTTSTPEPSSLLMLGSGLLGLMGMGLRRKGIV